MVIELIIYIDILFIINLYIGYFLIVATKRILNINISIIRVILGSILSGVFSLIILVDMPIFIWIIVKIAMLLLLYLVVFFQKGKKPFKTIFGFLFVNFAFAGLMFFLYYIISPPNMQMKNGVLYFDINVVILFTYTVIAYLIIVAFDFIFKRKASTSQLHTLTIEYNGKSTAISALYDSGNKLIDIFTGLPVVVCNLNKLNGILSQSMYTCFENDCQSTNFSEKIRVIPISSVGGNKLLMAFKPDRILVDNFTTNAIIAVSKDSFNNTNYDAIIGFTK
ncbi:MAG: sigma-E processing peptidase SpoIIGA [Oscillospiraceae bacterium]